MNGRFLGIKKTIVLRFSAVFNFLLFATLTLCCILLFKKPTLWFYSLCLSVGLYQLCKGVLFRLDSAFYFGSLTLAVGAVGFLFTLLQLQKFAVFFIALAFAVASIFTFAAFRQKFHLVFTYSLSFVNLYGFLLAKNLITTSIFLAFVVPFLLQLVISVILKIEKGI
jgi:hypothetical protein